jgi:hypothetical protein
MPLVLLKTGVTREYSERDAKLLVLVKKGVIVEEQPPEDSEAESQQTKPKRQYKRKDLSAEG